MERKRYWPLAIFSVAWIMISLAARGMAGMPGTSAGAALWVIVVIYAFQGNLAGIRRMAVIGLAIQILVGAWVLFAAGDDPMLRELFGPPPGLAIALAIPMILWTLVFHWANTKLRATGAATTESSRAKHHGRGGHAPRKSTAASVAVAPAHAYARTSAGQSESGIGETTSEGRRDGAGDENGDVGAPARPAPFTLQEIDAGQILVDHDDKVRAAFAACSGLPEFERNSVLASFARSPDGDPFKLRNAAILQALGRPDLAWSEDFERILRRLADADPEEVATFLRAFPVLSRRVGAMEVLRRTVSEDATMLVVYAASGREVCVTRRGPRIYEIASHAGTKEFASLAQVQDYLGTPARLRRPEP